MQTVNGSPKANSRTAAKLTVHLLESNIKKTDTEIKCTFSFIRYNSQMTDLFETKKEARDFINERMKDLLQTEARIVGTLSSEIINQDHLSFVDFKLSGRHDVSILQYQNGYKVEIAFTKYSTLVLAAEIGDLNIFQKEMTKEQTPNALSLAFVRAIQNEKLDILHFFYSGNYLENLTLFKEPLITASRNDKLNSFQFLLRKGFQLPDEILANIFHDNSKLIMKYIIADDILSKEILKEKYQTSWAINGLRKKDNDSTRMFNAHLNGC